MVNNHQTQGYSSTKCMTNSSEKASTTPNMKEANSIFFMELPQHSDYCI